MSHETRELAWLAEQFEANRPHLQSVAYRMLGSANEADDAVQESWLRLSRADASGIANMGGWLTTAVARVCLDMLRSRKTRREDSLETTEAEALRQDAVGIDPEQEAVLADSLGLALLVVLDTLSPAERLAFVLHDLFDVPFDDIAPIVGRSATNARQLASRARRRVRGAATDPDADLAGQRAIVAAFLDASRSGNFDALLAALDPEVTLRSDAAAVLTGSPAELHGPLAVARLFSGRARDARLAVAQGAVGLVWALAGEPRVYFRLTLSQGKISAIEIVAEKARLRALGIKQLDA